MNSRTGPHGANSSGVSIAENQATNLLALLLRYFFQSQELLDGINRFKIEQQEAELGIPDQSRLCT